MAWYHNMFLVTFAAGVTAVPALPDPKAAAPSGTLPDPNFTTPQDKIRKRSTTENLHTDDKQSGKKSNQGTTQASTSNDTQPQPEEAPKTSSSKRPRKKKSKQALETAATQRDEDSLQPAKEEEPLQPCEPPHPAPDQAPEGGNAALAETSAPAESAESPADAKPTTKEKKTAKAAAKSKGKVNKQPPQAESTPASSQAPTKPATPDTKRRALPKGDPAKIKMQVQPKQDQMTPKAAAKHKHVADEVRANLGRATTAEQLAEQGSNLEPGEDTAPKRKEKTEAQKVLTSLAL